MTYVWLGQALLMTIALWGGGTTDDLADRIRTGDIAIDLYRPVGLVGGTSPADLGRAAYHLLTRGFGPTLIGLASSTSALPGPAARRRLRGVAGPRSRGQLRDPVPRASTAFWLLDQSGVKVMSGAFAIFFSGMMLPLVLFPGWLGTLANALPWASYVQVPADIWLGKHTGTGLAAALGFQVFWAVVAAHRVPGRAGPGHAQGGGPGWLRQVRAPHLRTYGQIAWLWIRAAWQYPTSFVLLAVGNGLITGLDFVGLWIMFAHLRRPGGFSLHEVALLYGSASLALAWRTPRSAVSSGSAPTSAPAGSTR